LAFIFIDKVVIEQPCVAEHIHYSKNWNAWRSSKN